MSDAAKSVTIRLGTSGKADIKNDFAEIAASGDASAKRLVSSFDKANDDIERATARRNAAVSKIEAMRPTSIQATINANNGTIAQGGYRDAGGGGYDGSQNASATQYAALLAQQERQVEAVRAAIDPLYASQKRYDQEVAIANGLAAQGAISEEERAKAINLSAAALERARSAAATAVSPVRMTGSDADAHVAAYEQQLALQRRQADGLRSAIDPLYAAQKRYDEEVRVADGLLSRNVISEGEHRAAVSRSEKALQDAKKALDGHSNSLGINQMQFVIGESAVHRFVDSILAGQNPLKAFAMQAGDVANVISMDDGGVAGGLAKVRALFNPLTIGIASVTVALIAGTAAWISYTDARQKLAALSQGAGAVIGMSGGDWEASARAAADAGDISIKAATDIEIAYVKMGGIGKEVLGGLTALTGQFAAATGQDLAGAEEQLGRAFQDPVKGAQELTEKFGSLTQKQISHIQDLVEQNDLYGAQRALLDALAPQFDHAADHANILAAAWHGIEDAASDAWTAMGKALALGSEGDSIKDKIGELNLMRGRVNGPTDAQIDAEIAGLRKQLQDAANTAAGNKTAQDAAGIVGRYTGDDQRSQLAQDQGKLTSALASPQARANLQQAGQLDQARETLDAYTHAVSTYLSPAQKKLELDKADVAIAAAKTPAEKAAAAAAKERINQSGQIVTSAQAEQAAIAKGNAARDQASRSGAGHAATLAREAASMEVSARAAIDVATAYLSSASAGEEAEARRKALTDATKKGIDTDAEVRRQLALAITEDVANSAKSVSALRQETAARTQADLAVADGKLAIGQMGQALSDEAALRDLTTKQLLAQKLGLTQYYADITTVIDAYRAALADAHDEEAHGQALQSLDAIKQRVEDAQLATRFAGDTSGGLDLAKAALAANRQADAQGSSVDDRAALVTGNVGAARAEQDQKRADTLAQLARSQANDNELTQLQLTTVTATGAEQERMLDRLRVEQQLRAAGVDLASAQAQAILAGVDAEDGLKQKLQSATDAWGELRSEGDKFIDDLTNPDGSGLKSLLHDVEQELLKLAAINPLKNLLLGENNPTISSVGSVLKRLGGGLGGINLSSLSSPGLGLTDLSTMSTSGFDFMSAIDHFASGSDYTSGGAAWVGENGPEIVNLPQGSKVTNAADTRRMMTTAGNNGRGGDTYHISGNLLTPEWWSQIQAGNDHAAMRGATGGAQIAAQKTARQQRQRLGTR